MSGNCARVGNDRVWELSVYHFLLLLEPDSIKQEFLFDRVQTDFYFRNGFILI